jgi:hypothetical protein
VSEELSRERKRHFGTLHPLMTQPSTIRIALVGVLLAAAPAAGVAQEVQRVAAPSTVQRSAAEGRRLAEQNFALRQALRALERIGPEPSRVTLYITQKRDDERWRVYFGSLDFAHRQFRVAYVAAQAIPGSEEFVVTSYPEDVPANEFVSRAAMALMTALNAFEPPRLTFFPHVFHESDGRWVTYFLPEMVPPGHMPLQVDSRIVVSPDTRRVLESTRFYAEISFSVEFDGPAAARMRTRRELASLERFLTYYVPRAAAHPSVAPLALLLAYYSCSITPPQLAPGCWR